MLAERLNVASPSVSAMIKRLSKEKPPLVDYESHRGVTLTPQGKRLALETIRRHRLLEAFLCTALGFRWDEVHEEAERLEHHISKRLESRIAEYLGNPKYDPHGDPIPSSEGRIAEVKYTPLSHLTVGQSARILRVTHERPDLLRYLASLGLEPDAIVTITEKQPFDGPIFVRVGDDPGAEPQGIGAYVADMVLVEPLS